MSISATSSSSTKTTNRITGMATGMDTDAMVKAMTANIQTKINKQSQDKQILEWKQEMYKDIIKDIKGLQDYFDPVSSKYILGKSSFNPISITNSNESSVGFSATSTAQAGNYKINVTQLAKPAVLQGSQLSATTTTSTKLEELGVVGTISFEINGETVTTDPVTSSTTIQNVIDKINNDAAIKASGVTASFDELTKKFIFTTNSSGGSAKLENVSVTNGDKLGLDKLYDTNLQEQTSVNGQNAKFTITYPDGRIEPISNQTSNQFTANGITYNLKSTGTSNITVSKNNADKVVSNLENFINDYNNIIDKIQSKLTEKKQYSYKPLTDAQKEEMSDSDIEKWETKAKQGILRNDDYLESLLTELRGNFLDPVYSSKSGNTKNSFNMGKYGANALGIDTSGDVEDAGKLVIVDEDKLKNAITNNIEDFTKFFISKSSTTLPADSTYRGSDTYYEDGLFTRIDKVIRNYAGDPGIGKDGTSTVKGVLNIFANKQYDYSITGSSSNNTMPDQIYRKNLNIDQLQTKLTDAENRYYAKFAQLETAMNQMNAQMSNFQSQMGISQ